MRVTVVLNEAGEVVAAHVPAAGPDESAGDQPPTFGFVPSDGEEVAELDLQDLDVPSDPERLLELLQSVARLAGKSPFV
jgi:hypothetical protein